MKDYDVVGYADENGDACIDCAKPTRYVIFAGSESAEVKCVVCGDWLLGEEPDHLVKERKRAEEEAYEKEIADQEAREEAEQLEAIQDAAEEAEELEKMLAKARAKAEALAAAREKRIKDE
jgi:flagellar motility protein MotE (MotC chaperone)